MIEKYCTDLIDHVPIYPYLSIFIRFIQNLPFARIMLLKHMLIETLYTWLGVRSVNNKDEKCD